MLSTLRASTPIRIVVIAVAICFALGHRSPAAAAPVTPAAPLLAGGPTAIAEEYIVVFKQAPGPAARRTAAASADAITGRGGSVSHRYGSALTGYAARLPEAALDAVRADPDVAFVAPNEVHYAAAQQTNAPWHLDRIDQATLPLNTVYNYTNTGQGVHAYVLDSGIRSTHTQFQGRVVNNFTSINDGRGTNDCHGHGTFVGSEVGGATSGVAKTVTIHNVRILDCSASGTTAQIVAGMDWVAANHVKPAVANMSIQSANGLTNAAMDAAATGMINAGVVLVLIAGNFNKSDCRNSPKEPRAIITAASTRTDARWASSSYGTCVTVFAPGAAVTGAGIASDTSVATNWSGTSMAAPLVTGTIAKAMQSNPALTMAQAKQLIISTATTGVLTGIGAGSPNRLLRS